MKNLYTQIFGCKDRTEKKELLKALSQKAKAVQQLEDEPRNINSILIEMYTNEIHQEFKTFKGWIKENKRVKKGEKGFFVWSKKLKGTEKKEGAEEDKDFKFFGIAYIFSNAQVE
ncbi:ArdC-like ssDNA-binding domain-containing protein [Algibacter miyuki]|uniref:ArdC-like ssDNA-binding domain-containing protein n=1 Tax=Algibacter miyuki TaxID=1306933 RepID=A0ABV5H3V8_9FLAO|nr:ArdC-like ssDNA-binding domain-containing protein [Algibacter miyuki]MDN3665624.1 ArdC-like ssDNA-binding domain-containing protein [Algibacter miyuki]